MNSAVAFLGAGNMGSAMISAMLENGVVTPQNIKICNKHVEKLAAFQKKGVFVSSQAEEVVRGTNYIFLAVKPQDSGELLEKIRGQFAEDTVLISIAAGLSVAWLQAKSGLKKIIRVMPNTPAQVRMGVSGMYAGESVNEEEKEYVEKLLKSFSTVIHCSDEDQINAITALSGSGPAYFFRILEIIATQAEEFGFSPEEAREIVLETMRGAGELAKESGESFTMLREKVTSKGGTTEAALKSFEEQELGKVLASGITAALWRAKSLED